MPQYVLQRITLNHLLYKEVRLKTCRVCGKEKELEEFEKNKRRADGYDNRCLACGREYKKQKLIEKHGSVYFGNKRYRDSHQEYLKQKKHQDYVDNREAVLAQHKEYYEKHRERISAQVKGYKEANADRKKQWDKDYAKAHPEVVRRSQRAYWERHRSDEAFRIRYNLSGRIYRALCGLSKSKATMHLLGCSIEELQEYLSSKFQDGMSWDNYGLDGWHVDHIRPCASFDLADPEQQKICFHYSNLQPLWAVDNMSKGSLWQGARRYRSKRKN